VSLIEVRELTKEYVRPKRVTGPFGAIRTFFSREYDRTLAVAGVSFSVAAGEIVGYLGPNGAGKSTTIKLLTGVLRPTSGTVTIVGPEGPMVPWRDRERNARHIGVVFGQRSQLWWDLPLEESFQLIKALYDIPSARYARTLGRLRELLGLDEFINTPVRHLSLGQRMRGDLAAALLHEPPLLYLDEPTVGLDVLAKETVRSFVEETNRTSGTTILLTTHDLADVERLCRRIILIDHGRVLYDGSTHGLIARYAPYRDVVVRLDPDQPEPSQGPQWRVGQFIAERDLDGAWRFSIPRDLPIHTLLTGISVEWRVHDLTVEQPDLEAVIKRLYGERRAL